MQCNGEYLDKERMLKCERALEWRGRDPYLYVDGRPAIWNTASHPEWFCDDLAAVACRTMFGGMPDCALPADNR